MRERFVCVRITRMNGVDLNRFDFDYDVTWNSFFLDEKLNVYSRYGGRDEGRPEARLSKESLLQTMKEVLAAHERKLAGNREEDEPLFQPVAGEKSIPEEIPLLKQSHEGCIHCHQVREYQFLQWSKDQKFDGSRIFNWPLPEGLGIEFDLQHGHRVEGIQEKSAAELAGLSPGDVLLRADGVPIRSEYDFRWAMKRALGRDALELIVERSAAAREEKPAWERLKISVPLQGDWNKTDVGWRKSMRSVPLQWGFRAYALTRSQLVEEGLPEGKLAIRVVSVRNQGLAAALKIVQGDIIVALEGKSEARSFERFQSDLLRRYEPGDIVSISVRRGGEELTLTGPRPKWYTDETSVP